MTTQIFIWWLVAQALGLAGLPLARFVFRALPDRGYAFAKPLGLLLTGYLAWLIAMLGLAPFGAPLLVLSALAVGGIGLFVARRTTNDDTYHTARFSILNSQFSIPQNWRMILGYEALFALALVFLASLRSRDFDGFIGPNPWGTERPMDYALFNAILRSASFPPHDPWLSGYSINYYYFGYLLMAVMATLSGLATSVAYNLSLALIFALTALGVAGMVFNLIVLTTTDDHPTSYVSGRWSVVGGRLTAIVLAVVLVLFAANQGGALQVITGTTMAVALEAPDLGRAIVNGLGPREPLYLSRPFKGEYFDGTSVITPTSILEATKTFNYWNPTRAVWDDYSQDGETARRYAITEFPFFSFWLGDMHPHVMALPFGLLALALALQTVARPAAPPFAMGRRGWLELALTSVMLGSQYLINSWDFPTYLLLFLGALLILHVRLGTKCPELGQQEELEGAEGIATPRPVRRVWWRLYASQAIMVLLGAVLLFIPFHLTFRSLVGRLDPVINLPILSTITRTLGIVTRSRTPIYSFLIIFGLFLLPLVVYVAAQGPAGTSITRSPVHPFTRSLLWIALATLILGPLIGFPMLVLLPLAIYAALLAVERAEQPAAAFTLWGFAVGCLILFGTDVVYIRDVFEGYSARLNTIFKFYYQAWLIWGLLAGYALWWLAAVFLRTENHPEGARPRIASRRLSTLGSRFLVFGSFGLFALLLVGALVYPWLTAGKSLREGQTVGLAGKTPREQTPDGAAAIAWLRANTSHNAVILEAVGGDYNGEGFGGVSAATGLATVMGWPGHEDQWRGGDPAVRAMIEPRKAGVTTIYTTTDVEQARTLLEKYKVNYVYIGQLERTTFPPEGLAKFAQLGEPVFQQGDVTIYRVAGQ
jgi:YYY domain-containing protein